MRSLVLFTTILALSACSGDKTTTVKTDDGKEIKITADGDNDAESGTITFEGKDGEEGKITFGADAAKQGLPMGMPIYPGADVKGAFSGGDAKGMGGMATVVSSASAADVVAFYKAEAIKRGMKVKTESTTKSDDGEMTMFSAESADGGNLAVTVTPGDDGKTTALIMGGSKN
jgi:hypothetical protein